MSVDAKQPATSDVIGAGRERVKIVAAPEWVVPCEYSPEFKAKAPGSVTHLLMERQVHAELHQTFVRMVVRLETMQAVQHHSQWRLEFVPQTQSIDLHSIKITRGGKETEHAVLERIHFLQREAGLEGFFIQGWVTLLLPIEDVQPGDILEWSYTLHSHSQFLPNSCWAFFPVPENIHLGKFRVSVIFSEARNLKWKSSSADFSPVEQCQDGRKNWLWLREDYLCPEREKNTPGWHVTQPWIQISDCQDWKTIARAAFDAWKEDSSSPGLAARAQELTSGESDSLKQVQRAIQFVQDEFRYLSVSLEAGAHVPADAEAVIRRRYGDCKDLTFLLVQLLRRMGIRARPVLVNTGLQKSIKNMLPAPTLFNHVVAEYQIGDEVRWVDATIKAQGGGALNRNIPHYGLGLPIDPEASDLVEPPAGSLQPGAYELKESFLIDTTGNFSYLGVVIKATGGYADSLRFQFQNEGAEVVSKNRLQAYTNRFSQANRVDTLRYRDDRDANEFVLAEVFEINGFLKNDPKPGFCWMHLQNDSLMAALPRGIPGKIRTTPLALPHPCRISYTFEVESLGLELVALPAYRLRNEFFEFASSGRGVRKFTTATFSLTTLTDAVPPERLTRYLRDVEKVMPAALLRLRLPIGYARMRKGSDFGALPEQSRQTADGQAGAQTAAKPGAPRDSTSPPKNVALINSLAALPTEKAIAEAQRTVLLDSEPAPRRSHRRKKSRSWAGLKRAEILAIAGFVLLLTAFFALMALIRHGAH